MQRAFFRQFASTCPTKNGKQPRFLQTIKEASKPALKSSQPISRPFGYDKPVHLNPPKNLSLSGIKDDLFSEDAKERRQKKLDHDIKHSPFYESKSFTNTGGKIFTPPVSFFKRDKSKYFPDCTGSTVEGTTTSLYQCFQNHVNIVRIFSTMSGEKCTESYFDVDGQNYLKEGYEEFKTKHPYSQIVDINVPESWIKHLMVNLSKGSIRKILPAERRSSYFVIPESVFSFDARQKLMCDNRPSGYIYLVDPQGRLRWATSGNATDDERNLFWKCVNGLEKEYVSLSS
ncbi:Piso0_001343 [Millerozyma farinosa CBS 7064]|uniref:Piso0_001343 protein n=1 Tax=Pichia sorbitophila (strain ATCC MYA-4447 / BCRC 22081 / CBS 7064 / NBRC 10061 / NRRL Y-12695) TaxID=559304 RepID=G8YMH8_PICSO|nr:Piso0_001343 [Millerozyma farinosa CBS 7064]